MFSLATMFHAEPSVVSFEADQTIRSEEVNGQVVILYENVSPPDHIPSFHDLDIQTFIDAGLIDKLSEGKPIKMSLLDRQDAIYNEVDIVDKLHLEAQVAQRRAEKLAAIEGKLPQPSESSQPSEPFQSSSK